MTKLFVEQPRLHRGGPKFFSRVDDTLKVAQIYDLGVVTDIQVQFRVIPFFKLLPWKGLYSANYPGVTLKTCPHIVTEILRSIPEFVESEMNISYFFNRPGVTGAVLQTASSLR